MVATHLEHICQFLSAEPLAVAQQQRGAVSLVETFEGVGDHCARGRLTSDLLGGSGGRHLGLEAFVAHGNRAFATAAPDMVLGDREQPAAQPIGFTELIEAVHRGHEGLLHGVRRPFGRRGRAKAEVMDSVRIPVVDGADRLPVPLEEPGDEFGIRRVDRHAQPPPRPA